MIFDWHEYLDIARFLHQNVDKYDQITQESAYRSAISRAYFAAYCHARNYAQDKFGFIPKENSDDHAGVRKEFIRKGRAFANIPPILDTLRHWRNECDYQDALDNTSEIVQDAIDKSQKIFDSLSYAQPKKKQTIRSLRSII